MLSKYITSEVWWSVETCAQETDRICTFKIQQIMPDACENIRKEWRNTWAWETECLYEI